MTTYADSTIPAFTAALIAGLTAQLADPKVVISDGPAAPGATESEAVIEILDAEVDVSAYLDATTQPRGEEGQIRVLITVQQATRGKQTTVNERAFALLAALNTLLRSKTELQGYFTQPAPGHLGFIAGARISRIVHTKRTDPNQKVREAGLDVTVIWKARI